MRIGGTSSKTKQQDTKTTIAIASILAKEAGNTLTAGSSRICSNGRNKKNKYSNGML